jgi:Methylamine utilisation protein MauE
MSAPPITAPYLAAVALLGGAGAVKAVRPWDTANALRAAGWPSHPSLVRLGAVVEMAVAVAALAAPGRVTGSLVAACYLAFAGFIGLALRRGWVIASCGCFGRPDTPPTVTHLVLDLAAAGSAVWWAFAGPSRLSRAFDHQPWGGFPLVLVAAVAAYLAYLVFTNPLRRPSP